MAPCAPRSGSAKIGLRLGGGVSGQEAPALRRPNSIAEIIDDYWLYARCLKCGHRAILDLPGLKDRYGKHATLTDLRARLVCSSCRQRIVRLDLRHRYDRYYDPVESPRG